VADAGAFGVLAADMPADILERVMELKRTAVSPST
jgi:hypothetical protein